MYNDLDTALQYIIIYIVDLGYFVILFKQIHLCLCQNDSDLVYIFEYLNP